MSLQFAATHILWRQFERHSAAPAVDDAQLKQVKDFVEAFFHAHGHTAQAQDRHASRWYAAQHLTFRAMLTQLVGELATQIPLNDVELVVLAHWTPDVEVGCSVTNAIIHQTGAHDAFGIAISDHGLSSPFLALQAIEDYLDDTNAGRPGKKALLLIADQDAIMYPSPSLERFNPVASACVVMLQKRADEPADGRATGIVFKQYRTVPFPATQHALETLLNRLDMFTSMEEHLPLLILTTACFAAQLRMHAQWASHRIESWDDALLCSAPWARLQQLAPNSHRILMMQPQDNALSCAGLVVGD